MTREQEHAIKQQARQAANADDDLDRERSKARAQWWVGHLSHELGIVDRHGMVDVNGEVARAFVRAYLRRPREVWPTPDTSGTGPLRESRIVADFNTLSDLIDHAGRELGATHVSGSESQTKIYFPRGGQLPYEEATVWRKNGYWHAQGPGSRTGVEALPAGAKAIGSGERGRRAAESGHRDLSRMPYEELMSLAHAHAWSPERDAAQRELERRRRPSVSEEARPIGGARRAAESHVQAGRGGPKPYRPARGRVGFTVHKVLSGPGGGKDIYFDDGFMINVHRGGESGLWYAMRPFDKTYENRTLSLPEIQAHQYAAIGAALGDRASSVRYLVASDGMVYAESRGDGSHVEDYIAVDPRGRTIGGPFKNYSDADRVAGPADHVKFVPGRRASEPRGKKQLSPRGQWEREVRRNLLRWVVGQEAARQIFDRYEEEARNRFKNGDSAYDAAYALWGHWTVDNPSAVPRQVSETRVAEPNDARDVLDGLGPYLEHEGKDAPRESARIARMIASAGRNSKKAEEVLEQVNKLIDGHGVEAIRNENAYDNYYGDAIATYVNMGDTYDTTLLYDIREREFHVTSWGDWYEAWEGRRDDGGDMDESRKPSRRAREQLPLPGIDEHRGREYASDQLNSEHFNNWIWEQMVEGEAMRKKDPTSVIDDLRQVAKNMLQDLEYDTRRETRESAEFFEGLRAQLHDRSTVNYLVEELVSIQEQLRTPKTPTSPRGRHAPKKVTKRKRR